MNMIFLAYCTRKQAVAEYPGYLVKKVTGGYMAFDCLGTYKKWLNTK